MPENPNKIVHKDTCSKSPLYRMALEIPKKESSKNQAEADPNKPDSGSKCEECGGVKPAAASTTVEPTAPETVDGVTKPTDKSSQVTKVPASVAPKKSKKPGKVKDNIRVADHACKRTHAVRVENIYRQFDHTDPFGPNGVFSHCRRASMIINGTADETIPFGCCEHLRPMETKVSIDLQNAHSAGGPTLKKAIQMLKDISTKIDKCVPEQPDVYQHFGNYIAGVLRAMPEHKAKVLKRRIVNIINPDLKEE